jgi:hypothetical protein
MGFDGGENITIVADALLKFEKGTTNMEQHKTSQPSF